MKITIIGYGNLAKAIAQGLLKSNQHVISVSSPSLSQGEHNGIKTHYDNKEGIIDAEVIILAVKPKIMRDVLLEINPYIPKKCLMISVAAGLTLDWFKNQCNPMQAVVRTIPNTPAMIGMAATPMIANEYTSSRQKNQADEIFNSIGISAWAKQETDMDVFTALSASGPAYVFLFIETLIKAAKALGLDETIATQFALQMVSGSALLAQQSDLNLKQLRERVATPSGTTAAALNVLDEGLYSLVFSALSAAKHRSIELAHQN